MPAISAYATGTFAPASRNSPEIRADSDSTRMSGPGALGDMRTAAMIANASRAAVTPAASQIRAEGRRDTSAVIVRARSPEQGLDGGEELTGGADHGAALAGD